VSLFTGMPPPSATTETHVIAVNPPAALAERPRLFAALELAFPVAFRPSTTAGYPAAVVTLRGASSELRTDGPTGRHLPVILFDEQSPPGVPCGDIHLLAHDAVDRRLRGVTLFGQLPASPLRPGADEEVLAVEGSAPRWTVTRGAANVQRVAAALPELRPDENLRGALTAGCSIAIVALTHFLRATCAGSDFAPPPLRASIIFDDPNVRRPSYGFIDFRRLVEHADRHNYHAAMAMVPLDAGRAGRAAVSLFKRRPDRLSLTVHGNSHLKNELADVPDVPTALSVCAQALRRVAAFEARTGLRVDRVMTPPHGMCSEAVATGLAAVGFDALCAIHPRPWSEEAPYDAVLAAWEPATFAGPSAVIPRFPLQSTATDIALRAFTDNPIILYGHHQDLASGLGLLERAAQRVNALGEVQWMSLGAIAASNVAVRTQAETVVIRPHSGRMRVCLPQTTGRVIVEEPRDCGGALLGWSAGAAAPEGFGHPAAAPGGREIEIRLRLRCEVDPQTVPAPHWRPWPKLRRTAAELRDRALPLAGA
jgi:hypothetical protein